METSTCYRHTDRETGRSCTRCGRPACPDCLHDAPVGSHCAVCTAAARPPARERLRRWNARTGALVTKVIVGLNLLVFVLPFLAGVAESRVQRNFALFGPAVANGDWYRLVTSGFVHFGLIHLGFNLAVLYRFGTLLESSLGRARMLSVYLASLLAGSLGAVLLSPLALTAGASGAVFGLVGAVAVGLRQRGVDVWQSGVGSLIVVNLVLTFVIPDISIGGHVGGLLGGAAVGGAMLAAPPDRRGALQGLAIALAAAAAFLLAGVWVAGR